MSCPVEEAQWSRGFRAATEAQQVIGATGFGSDAQTLHAFNGLQEGLVKLT